MDESVDSREQSAQRVRILEAVSSAIARRNEVMDVVSFAGTPEEALRALIELLAIDEVSAVAITKLQLRRFTLSMRAQIESELSDLRNEVSDKER